MSTLGFAHIEKPGPNPRDSLELASLASSEHEDGRFSIDSSPSGAASSRKVSLENDDPLDDSNHANLLRARERSYSMTSAFDFTPALFPLSSSASGYAPLGAPSTTHLPLDRSAQDRGNLEKHKTLSYLNGLSLVVGLIIGSGIFSSPSQVNSRAGSPAAALIVWTVAGVLAWTGAASYAELGGAIPLNGGSQVYLAKIFGELVGFLYTWCAVMVLKPGSLAIISIVFGEYTVRAVIGADIENINPWINKGVAVAALLLVTFVNCVSTKLAARISDLFMFMKFIALIAITTIGIIVAVTGLSYKSKANTEWRDNSWFEGTSHSVSGWAVALYAGLWAYDGWDNTSYVTGEFKNPGKDVPRVIHTAMPLVILFYILANISYFFVLPSAVIESSNTVAVKFGSKVFGPIGGLILALTVGMSCFGALNASTFTSSRLVYAAGKEGYLPAIFGKIGFGSGADNVNLGRLQHRSAPAKLMSKIFGSDAGIGFTPINAMILNAVITLGYITVGEFDTLLTFYGVAGYTFYFFTVLGLIVLRIREPNLERPYRTWITTPVIFCCVSLFLVSRAVFAEPVKSLIFVAWIVVGIPVYLWRIAIRDSGRAGQGKGNMKFWKRWGRSAG